MDNFIIAINKVWPNHPTTPKVITDIQNSEIVIKIVETELVKKAAEVANETESNFFSLRELYNKYSASWWSNTSAISDSLSFFDSWSVWLAMIIIGVLFGIYVYDIKHTSRTEPNIFIRAYNWLFHSDPKTPDSGKSGVLFNNQNSPGVDSVVDHPVTPPVEDIRIGARNFFNRIFNRVSQPHLPTPPDYSPWTLSNSVEKFKHFFRSPESPLVNKGKAPDKPYDWGDPRSLGQDPYQEVRLNVASGSKDKVITQPIPQQIISSSEPVNEVQPSEQPLVTQLPTPQPSEPVSAVKPKGFKQVDATQEAPVNKQDLFNIFFI